MNYTEGNAYYLATTALWNRPRPSTPYPSKEVSATSKPLLTDIPVKAESPSSTQAYSPSNDWNFIPKILPPPSTVPKPLMWPISQAPSSASRTPSVDHPHYLDGYRDPLRIESLYMIRAGLFTFRKLPTYRSIGPAKEAREVLVKCTM